MNRADIYEKSANISRAETGTETYDRMQETYRNSLEGRSNALTAAIEEIFLNAFETDSFYGLVDATTAVISVFGDLVKAIGGGGSADTGRRGAGGCPCGVGGSSGSCRGVGCCPGGCRIYRGRLGRDSDSGIAG